MKIIQQLILLSIFIVLFSACETECHDCSIQGVNETICESDYDSQTDYENALASIENSGGVCTTN